MYIVSSQPSFSVNAVKRSFWAGIFGNAICLARQERGYSVEKAAHLAGMETEWAEIEDGCVPLTQVELRSVAGTLEVSFDRMMNLVLLCRDAWEG